MGARPTMPEPRYLNQQLSELDFHARVLAQAQDARLPPLERARFLAIFAANLDDFFQVGVAGLKRQRAAGGAPVAELLGLIRARVQALVGEHTAAYAGLRRELAAVGIRLLEHADVPEHQARLRERFLEEIFPVLTPLAVDPGHPFPYISSLSLSIAVVLQDPDGAERFARVKVPPLLPRLVEVEPGGYVLLEEVMRANLDLLFPGMRVTATDLFRVTRDADLDIDEDEAENLLLAVEQELRRRRFGAAVRLEVAP